MFSFQKGRDVIQQGGQLFSIDQFALNFLSGVADHESVSESLSLFRFIP